MKKVKVKDHEKLSDANIQYVISLLESSKPITKKEACAILNISYNTTRLTKIIEEYKERKAYEASRREKNRGKPAEPHEIQTIVELYLSGENVTEIAKRLFRPAVFVSNIIERLGVPTRPVGDLKFEKSFLPEQCVAEEFAEKEIAWSAKFHRPCQIIHEITLDYLKQRPGMATRDYLKEDGSRLYSIYVMEPVGDVPLRWSGVRVGGHFAYAYAYDLGSLKHLKDLGIDLSKL